MPRLPPEVKHSPFYLYNSEEDARAGEPFGGTGFFVAYPTGIPDRNFVYAVTNWHVAVRDGASVIRVNLHSGGVDIFDLGPEDWVFKPGGPDIAIASIHDLRVAKHRVVTLQTRLLLTEQNITDLRIGIGDDVFMLGRFVDHDGADRNVPAGRFGHISVMPQIVPQPTEGNNLFSFILDVHSRTGYSGSPVFVYRTVGHDLTVGHPDEVLRVAEDTHFIKLLGITWGQFPELWEIEQGTATLPQGVQITDDARYIKGMSGMTLACPAWDIMELLEMPKFKEERAHRLQEMINPSRPVAESARPPKPESPTKADNPSHREDFTSLANAAARKRPRGD